VKDVKRVISTSFWDDDLVLDGFSPEDRYFMLYLLTNPHTTQLGIYHLPLKKAALETGYSIETIKVLLDRFETKYDLIRYSDTNEVAIKNYLRHSIVKGGTPVIDCLIKDANQVKDRSLLIYIYNHMSNYLNDNTLNKTVIEFINLIKDKYIYINNNNDNDNERIVPRIVGGEIFPFFIPDVNEMGKSGNIGGQNGNIYSQNGNTKRCDFDNGNLPIKPKVQKMGKDDNIDTCFEKLWKMYPRKLGKGKISVSQKRKLFEIGFDKIARCIERFNEKHSGTEERFIPYGSTFFNSGYVDYLDENYCPKGNDEIVTAPETEDETPIDLFSMTEEEYQTFMREHPNGI